MKIIQAREIVVHREYETCVFDS